MSREPSSSSASGSGNRRSRPIRDALEPVMTSTTSVLAGHGQTLAIVKEAIMAPFHGNEMKRSESIRMINDLAPQLMSNRIISNVRGSPSSSSALTTRPSSMNPLKLPSTILFPHLHLPLSRQPRATSTSLAILEAIPDLLALNPDGEDGIPGGFEDKPSLIRGFRATIPSSEIAKQRRRRIRSGLADSSVGTDAGGKIGLKRLGDRARGLLTDVAEEEEAEEGAQGDRDDVGTVGRRRKKRRHLRGSARAAGGSEQLSMEELMRQADEIAVDRENLNVRRDLIISEIDEVTAKIHALDTIRDRLESSLTLLQEEDLELDDELEGVRERMALPTLTAPDGPDSPAGARQSKSSRRRKGPAFLPSEHDELPSGVAFMTLGEHTAPITALDFSEPYGTLVTAGQDDVVKVWDLCDGEEIGQLRGHNGMVKVLQVEDDICLTGGADGSVRLWDLRMVEDWEERLAKKEREGRDVLKRDPFVVDLVEEPEAGSGIRDGEAEEKAEDEGPCVRVLEGHSKAVTALYYEEGCLVTGSSDKTIRQWDANTGQCVLTMDILWAIAHPPAPPPSSPLKPTNIPQMELDSPYASPTRPRLRNRSSTYFSPTYGSDHDDVLPSPGGSYMGGLPGAGILSAATGGAFAIPTPPYADGSWEMYQDFVGGVQFWGYALVSGSGDGGVRMWDMRTGQAHRTLIAHTGPVTCLQFDESYIVSGSLDKTIRTWDLRTGTVVETLRYDYPVTSLQFDSRKIVACTGENSIDVYNRISGAHNRLMVNGHIKPAERMRFMDKYLVSGGKDGVAKVWAL